YVGLETGMNSLIRPPLYGAYHPIVNLSRLDEPAACIAHVVGPICETGDILGRSRRLPPTAEGDVLLIANAGAYGRVMSSRYNLREPAGEMLLEEGRPPPEPSPLALSRTGTDGSDEHGRIRQHCSCFLPPPPVWWG